MGLVVGKLLIKARFGLQEIGQHVGREFLIVYAAL
jgi:hypothetical protein